MSIRALHVGKFYPPFAGGIEYFVADLLGGLRRAGLDVAAVVHDDRPGWRGRLPDPAEPPPVYRVPCHGRLLYVPVSPTFPRWLDRAIRDFDPHLLHLHLPNSSAFAALLLPRARRLPWVIHWHADLVASSIDRRLALAYRFYRPFEQRLLARSRAIVATSPPYLAASAALAPWRARCIPIPLGLDPQRLSEPSAESAAWATSQWGRASLRVLAIGRLTYYKGHDRLIRALDACPDARLVIVGAGEERPRLAALVRALNLEARVALLGFRSDPETAALLASCDLLCLPSVERTEAFGLVLLEAMRYGKSVVVSDIPGSGTGWVVRRAGHGVLVPPDDVAALTAALHESQRDPRRRDRFGQAGVVALAREFQIDAVATQVASLYSRVLAAGGEALAVAPGSGGALRPEKDWT